MLNKEKFLNYLKTLKSSYTKIFEQSIIDTNIENALMSKERVKLLDTLIKVLETESFFDANNQTNNN